jgi:thioredoxin
MSVDTKIREIGAADFDAEVLGASQPVLVDFWAEWCGPCRMMAPLLDDSAQRYGERVQIAKVNIDEHPAIASRYHVRSIPTLMIFKDGVPVATQVGAVNRARLDGFIEAQL